MPAWAVRWSLHVDDNPVAVVASGDVAQQGRGRGQTPPPPPDRQDFHRRHDAEGAVPQLAGSIRVSASTPWTDSRITVRRATGVVPGRRHRVLLLDEGATAGPERH